MEPLPWREFLSNSIRYWEPRRVLYNCLLVAIVVFHFVHGLPFSKVVLQFNSFLLLFALAVLREKVEQHEPRRRDRSRTTTCGETSAPSIGTPASRSRHTGTSCGYGSWLLFRAFTSGMVRSGCRS